MRKQVHINSELVAKKVLSGIEKLAKFVGMTLGPAGRPIMMEEDSGVVLITKDGVSCSKRFESDDPIENVVALAARESCERTVRKVGDGTTTAIVLAHALVEAGQEFLKANPHMSPQLLARNLKSIFQDELKPQILAFSKPVRGIAPEEAKRLINFIALVSANHDQEIADAVTKAVEYVGEDGMVLAEEGVGSETIVAHRDGFPVSSGLRGLGTAAAASFVNKTSNGECNMGTSYVVMYDGEINDLETLQPILNEISMEKDERGNSIKSPVLVVAHAFGNHVLRNMAEHFRRGLLTCVPFVTHRNGQALGKQAFLYDLAAYVGGKVFDPQGYPLQAARLPELGAFERAKISQDEAVIFTDPDIDKVSSRIAELKEQMEGASDYDKDRLRYRIGQMTGGVATIYAGGSTGMEAKERNDRVVDAVSAVRSAMEMGVIPGGGSVLATIAKGIIPSSETNPASNPRSIFAQALQRPLRLILDNGGFIKEENSYYLYLNSVGPSGDKFFIANALNGQTQDWMESGVLDPAKVCITALENALSVAQLLMTLGGVVVVQSTESAEQMKSFQDGLLKAVHGDLAE